MKTIIILRGLPCSGKSFKAKKLVEASPEGVVYSTDEFWHTQVKPEKPDDYNFVPRFLGQAHKWNQLRAQKSIELGHPLIIIDNTNVSAQEIFPYASYAHYQGYEVEIQEPESEWWLQIRELLYDKRVNKQEIKKWAFELAEKSKLTHNVPQWSIERMMWRWQPDLTLDTILQGK